MFLINQETSVLRNHKRPSVDLFYGSSKTIWLQKADDGVCVSVSGPDKDIVPDLKLPHGDKSLVFLVCQRIGVWKIYQNHYSILS